MLLTLETKNAATSLLENNPASETHLSEAVRKRILNSAVRIRGSSKDQKDLFTGSGVIYNVDATTVYILSAAHNLLVWAKDQLPPNNNNWNNYTGDFAKAMSIQYGKANLTFNAEPGSSAGVFKVSVPQAQVTCVTGACMYDLMLITSKDAGLLAYATQSVFGGQQNTIKQEGPQIINSAAALLNSSDYHYIQLGFGKIEDDRYREWVDDNDKIEQSTVLLKKCGTGFNIKANTLHYRLANTSFKAYQTYYRQIADAGQLPAYIEYPEVISLSGKVMSTTAEGDSGGPLYAVDKSSLSKVYLLGVSTGVDMEAAAVPALRVFKNCLSTSVVPFLQIP